MIVETEIERTKEKEKEREKERTMGKQRIKETDNVI